MMPKLQYFYLINQLTSMSMIEIVEQDSLLENSQIQYFIQHQKKTRQPKCSTALYPAQIIPEFKQRAFSSKKQQSHGNLLARGSSASSFTLRQFSATKSSFRNGSYSQAAKHNLLDLYLKAGRQLKKSNEASINIQKINQMIDFRQIFQLKQRNKSPFVMARKLSANTLSAKSKVENVRKLIQKKLVNSPFQPAFIQSQYLE